MKTTFLTIVFFSLISSTNSANTPTNIEDQNGTSKNTATFSTKTMQATFNFDGNNLLTLCLNKTSTEKVKLSITKNGFTIFTDSYTSVQELNKGYDLSELPKGKYIIVLLQGSQKFEKMIEKTSDTETSIID